jgi:hypothetical protein
MGYSRNNVCLIVAETLRNGGYKIPPLCFTTAAADTFGYAASMLYAPLRNGHIAEVLQSRLNSIDSLSMLGLVNPKLLRSGPPDVYRGNTLVGSKSTPVFGKVVETQALEELFAGAAGERMAHIVLDYVTVAKGLPPLYTKLIAHEVHVGTPGSMTNRVSLLTVDHGTTLRSWLKPTNSAFVEFQKVAPCRAIIDGETWVASPHAGAFLMTSSFEGHKAFANTVLVSVLACVALGLANAQTYLAFIHGDLHADNVALDMSDCFHQRFFRTSFGDMVLPPGPPRGVLLDYGFAAMNRISDDGKVHGRFCANPLTHLNDGTLFYDIYRIHVDVVFSVLIVPVPGSADPDEALLDALADEVRALLDMFLKWVPVEAGLSIGTPGSEHRARLVRCWKACQDEEATCSAAHAAKCKHDVEVGKAQTATQNQARLMHWLSTSARRPLYARILWHPMLTATVDDAPPLPSEVVALTSSLLPQLSPSGNRVWFERPYDGWCVAKCRHNYMATVALYCRQPGNAARDCVVRTLEKPLDVSSTSPLHKRFNITILMERALGKVLKDVRDYVVSGFTSNLSKEARGLGEWETPSSWVIRAWILALIRAQRAAYAAYWLVANGEFDLNDDEDSINGVADACMQLTHACEQDFLCKNETLSRKQRLARCKLYSLKRSVQQAERLASAVALPACWLRIHSKYSRNPEGVLVEHIVRTLHGSHMYHNETVCGRMAFREIANHGFCAHHANNYNQSAHKVWGDVNALLDTQTSAFV